MNKYNSSINSIIKKIIENPKKGILIFNDLELGQKRDVILRIDKHFQLLLISKIHRDNLIILLEYLDSDEATDLLQLLSTRKRNTIVKKLNKRMRDSVTLLLKFDPNTVAGLMSINYILVEHDNSLSSVVKQIKIHEKRTGKIPDILVMKNGHLAGHLPTYQLIARKSTEKVNKYFEKIHTITYNRKLKEAIEIFKQIQHNKIVVLGKNNNVLGIVYSDDILRIMENNQIASLYNFAGVDKEETVFDSIEKKVAFRYKWLIINLGTAFLAALTVNLFDEIISKYVLLAVYMPIVAGMGGNAATQTMAVMIRGLALKQINFKTIWKTMRNELGAAFINGLINAIIIFVIVVLKDNNYLLAMVLGMAMIINMINAAFFGTIVPLIMNKLGKDPASSATIFITTATDVIGFLVFLGLATLILD